MARGWESKAVADQIEEGKATRPDRRRSAATTPEERLVQERLSSLFLSKARLLDQLELAKHAAHRRVLLNGLKAIEQEIDKISTKQ